jgi:hypothetical protein
VECPQKELAYVMEKNTWICGLDLIYIRIIFGRESRLWLKRTFGLALVAT